MFKAKAVSKLPVAKPYKIPTKSSLLWHNQHKNICKCFPHECLLKNLHPITCEVTPFSSQAEAWEIDYRYLIFNIILSCCIVLQNHRMPTLWPLPYDNSTTTQSAKSRLDGPTSLLSRPWLLIVFPAYTGSHLLLTFTVRRLLTLAPSMAKTLYMIRNRSQETTICKSITPQNDHVSTECSWQELLKF